MGLDEELRAALGYAHTNDARSLVVFDGLRIATTNAGEGPHVGLSRSITRDEQLARRRVPPPAASVGMLAVAWRLANLTDDERTRLVRGLAAHRKRAERARLDPAKVRAANAAHARAYRARQTANK